MIGYELYRIKQRNFIRTTSCGESFTLLRDGIGRLNNQGISINEVGYILYIAER